ncbi:uncharacterized protein C8A04DRAFT_39846 [Dichotomopilus funicola]|uniref:Protein kinase domain-containing protein n=1 Tax=Dichotomopilus funicola TaxID=1934379 RepID=A0AAN6ZJT7_9PEZI|nr:hypothetical protein C8A04DRAFT_39846 [Dichotomopilus funicola]
MYSPIPYQEGGPLDLEVWKSYSPNLPPCITATISRVISMTMSVVLEVTFQTLQGPPGHCDKPAPHTRKNEVTFEAFVRGGMMPAFLRYRKERNETETFPVRAPEFLDEPDRAEDYEHFECETETYYRLADHQGTLVPHIRAHVSLSATKLPTIIPQEVAPYFEVRGILLERIDGYCLDDLMLGPPPPNLRTWHHIIQSAVDTAYEINKRGVIMEDCAPRNVVVDKESQTPRIVDLAQCMFREEMVSYWCQSGWDEDEDWDPDVEYWEEVSTMSNPGAIGAVMANRIQRKMGVKMDFRYPDWNAIIAGIKLRKEEAAAGGTGNP